MSLQVNYDDVFNQMQSYGLLVDGFLQPGTAKPVRVKTEDDAREKRGWYWLNEVIIDGDTYIVGAYGIYHGNDSGKQTVKLNRDGKPVAIDPELRAAMKARQAENLKRMKAMREDEARRAGREAARVWAAYLPTGQSDYLARKGVGAHGVRFDPNGHGTMIVPMTDARGTVHGLQIIRGKDRGRKLEKQYWPAGLAKQGHYYLIGGLPSWICLIAEGYATAATLHEATGLPVAVAFDAGNLVHVAAALHQNYKRARILICADDDYLTDGNPGVTAASNAALAVNGSHIAPVFHADRAGQKISDFNDLHAIEGLHAVRSQIEAHLLDLNWQAPDMRPATTSGGGEGGARLSMMLADEVVMRFSPVWSEEDVYYFDHIERIVVKRQSIANRMPRSAWDQVTTHPAWQAKIEVPLTKVDFDPTESDASVVYNLWGGWPEIKYRGDASCAGILDLLRHLCSHEKEKAGEIYQWVLKWLAYPLQNPGAKMQSCILMHGGQGAGKNTVFDTMLEIYEDHAVEFGPSQLEKRFNALFSKKMFAIGNEVVASREDLYHVKGHIKHMITERRWVVEAKNKDERWERNCCNFIFLSNEINAQALDKGDRRHCVIWTPNVPDPQTQPDEWAQWQKLWGPAHEERRNGGYTALYHYLMKLDLEDFSEATWPPMTQAKQDLIDLNMDSRERFYASWKIEDIAGLPCIPVTSELLHDAYRAWTQKVGIHRPVPMHSLMAFIGKQPNVLKRQDNITKGMGFEKRTVVFPHYMHSPPNGKTKAVWLGECVEEFRTALEAYRQ